MNQSHKTEDSKNQSISFRISSKVRVNPHDKNAPRTVAVKFDIIWDSYRRKFRATTFAMDLSTVRNLCASSLKFSNIYGSTSTKATTCFTVHFKNKPEDKTILDALLEIVANEERDEKNKLQWVAIPEAKIEVIRGNETIPVSHTKFYEGIINYSQLSKHLRANLNEGDFKDYNYEELNADNQRIENAKIVAVDDSDNEEDEEQNSGDEPISTLTYTRGDLYSGEFAKQGINIFGNAGNIGNTKSIIPDAKVSSNNFLDQSPTTPDVTVEHDEQETEILNKKNSKKIDPPNFHLKLAIHIFLFLMLCISLIILGFGIAGMVGAPFVLTILTQLNFSLSIGALPFPPLCLGAVILGGLDALGFLAGLAVPYISQSFGGPFPAYAFEKKKKAGGELRILDDKQLKQKSLLGSLSSNQSTGSINTEEEDVKKTNKGSRFLNWFFPRGKNSKENNIKNQFSKSSSSLPPRSSSSASFPSSSAKAEDPVLN